MAMTNVKAKLDEAQKAIDFAKTKYQVELDTSMGKIKLDFLPEVAPGHVKNFVGLAKIGFYDNLIFHRVIDGFMNQGGCPQGTGMGDGGYKIKAEFNKTPHKAGVLSMARGGNDINSAGTQFFICNADALFLDNQYTAFGKVADAESLEVVKKIGKVKTRSERPLQDVIIKKATVIETPK
jgi:peptidyl-prolyl cis-trans isomerase B (cyclophilin B)